jgi:anti-anti-sigma factor
VERSSGAAPPRRSVRGSQEQGGDAELLTVEIERPSEGVTVVAVAGELDLSTVPGLEGQLLREVNGRGRVLVDLTRLSFVDSSGIGLLIKAHRARKNGAVLHTVVAPGSQVERVFALAGIDKALPLFGDPGEAMAALGASAAPTQDRSD